MDIKLTVHKHSLSFRNPKNVENAYCAACAKKISNAAYTCDHRCLLWGNEFWLHESCASELQQLPLQITHSLHLQHHLELQLNREDLVFVCDKCLYISIGPSYKCYACDFTLELACASSTNDPLVEEEWQKLKDGKKKYIWHFSHLHKLTIFNFRSGLEYGYCSWCVKPLSEVCCGCIGCQFFLHEGCRDKIPRTIYHPFHPSHRLYLLYKAGGCLCNACGDYVIEGHLNYWCPNCNFSLGFPCRNLSPTLKLECHDHPLTYFQCIGRYSWLKQFRCKVCDKDLDVNGYRCVRCNFNVHVHCAPIPSTAKHRYHRHPLIYMDSFKDDESGEYYCDVCENERIPMDDVYCCEECTFIAHIHCVLNEDTISSEKALSSPSQSIEEEMENNEGIDGIRTPQQLLIRPMIHEHPMRFCEVVDELREDPRCEACHLVLSGPCYICTECSIMFHEKCAKLPYEIQHPFHSGHPLNLYPYSRNIANRLSTSTITRCDECRDVFYGFYYRCDECGLKLDVKCATLTAYNTEVSRLQNMERVAELIHPNHHHKLVLANFNEVEEKLVCSFCSLPMSGPSYICHKTYCGFEVHESCFGMPQKMQLPFHWEHMLTFGEAQGYFWCYAYRMSFLGFRYSCEQCDLTLHSFCANILRRPLRHASHEHNLYYFGSKFVKLLPYLCSECKGDCEKFFYRCPQCGINFYLDCVPIPPVVESRHHIHLLTLKEGFFEDDSEESYCDVCEEERCPKDHVYHCEECNHFVAYIECVLPKIEDYTRDASSILKVENYAQEPVDFDELVGAVKEINFQELLQVFNMIDEDQDALISADELRRFMNIQFKKPRDEDVDELLRKLGFDGVGQFNYDDFIKVVMLELLRIASSTMKIPDILKESMLSSL